MKNSIAFFLLLLTFNSMNSQDIKFKKGILYVDEKECMKYDDDGNVVTFQNLNGDDIISIQYLRPDGTQQSLYCKVLFFDYKKEFTSQNYIYTKKLLIERMLKSKLLENCNFNEDKIDNFILKYDEKVEERLNRNSNNNTTIIIKEEPRRSGINLNIGR